MLDVNIRKTNKVVLALTRKKAKARTNAKKSSNTALPCLRETWEWNTFDPVSYTHLTLPTSDLV